MRFYLGTHKPAWLAYDEAPSRDLFPSDFRVPGDVCWFVQRGPLKAYKTFPRARRPWVLDSGGFTEVAIHGGWTTTAAEYAAFVRRARDEVGMMEWAAPQDWMCEPMALSATRLGVTDHQRLTVENYLDLRQLAPDLPIMPVLQGWEPEDYLRCVDRYDRNGVDLSKVAVVGLGTVCRRQGMRVAVEIIDKITTYVPGIRLHGFGFKERGAGLAKRMLHSTDSCAWSFHARKRPALPDCSHSNCANCIRYALWWRRRFLSRVEEA